MSELFRKYKEIIVYLFFGVATTVVNVGVFFFCREIGSLDYQVSTVVSWFLSVLFAFVTNKYFVFNSSETDSFSFGKEMFLFYWYRLLSLVIEMALLFLLIEQLLVSELFSKLFAQFVVIVLNYVFSKLFIFKKN